jgi:amylosucrase
MAQQDWHGVELAIGRILLVHSMIFAYGGIPLLYMGDELGVTNDHSYQSDPDLAADSRWIHRPYMKWETAVKRRDARSVPGRVFQGIQQLIAARQRLFQLHTQAGTYPVWTHNEHVFGLLRDSPRGRILVLGNFSESEQWVSRQRLAEMGFRGLLHDHVANETIDMWSEVQLRPYQSLWLAQID